MYDFGKVPAVIVSYKTPDLWSSLCMIEIYGVCTFGLSDLELSEAVRMCMHHTHIHTHTHTTGLHTSYQSQDISLFGKEFVWSNNTCQSCILVHIIVCYR